MKPSTALVIKAVLGFATAAVAAGGGSAYGARVAHQEHGDQLGQLIEKVDALSTTVGKVESDVRLLKCANDFPGDCPGQAAPPPRHAR